MASLATRQLPWSVAQYRMRAHLSRGFLQRTTNGRLTPAQDEEMIAIARSVAAAGFADCLASDGKRMHHPLEIDLYCHRDLAARADDGHPAGGGL